MSCIYVSWHVSCVFFHLYILSCECYGCYFGLLDWLCSPLKDRLLKTSLRFETKSEFTHTWRTWCASAVLLLDTVFGFFLSLHKTNQSRFTIVSSVISHHISGWWDSFGILISLTAPQVGDNKLPVLDFVRLCVFCCLVRSLSIFLYETWALSCRSPRYCCGRGSSGFVPPGCPSQLHLPHSHRAWSHKLYRSLKFWIIVCKVSYIKVECAAQSNT